MKSIRKFLATLMMISIALIAAWNPASAKITINYNSVLFTHPLNYHGVNYSAFWDDLQGSAASMNALKRSGVQLIRFPGGVSGNFYDWQVGASMSTTSFSQFGAYVRGVGAKALFQTNPYTNKVLDNGQLNNTSGRHAADAVTYAQQNNIPVIYWEVGNEPEIAGDFTMDYYYNKFIEQADSIHALHPGTVVMGPTGTNVYYWSTAGTLQNFIAKCGSRTDAISLHWYENGSDFNSGKALISEWTTLMRFIRSITSKPVYITEWSCVGPGTDDASTNWARTIGLALENADMIGAFAKTGVSGHFMFGCIHQVDGAWGLLAGNVDYRPAESAAPCYFILPMWCAMGNIVVQNTNTVSASDLSVYSHKKADSSLQVMLINKTAQTRSDTIAFSGFNSAGASMKIYQLKPQNADVSAEDVYYNTFKNPEPAIKDLPLPTQAVCSGSNYAAQLPPYSITMLDFRPSSANAIKRDVSERAKTISVLQTIIKGDKLVISVSYRDFIDANKAELILFDYAGKNISTKNLQPVITGSELSWELPALSAGRYFARIKADGQLIYQTIIKD